MRQRRVLIGFGFVVSIVALACASEAMDGDDATASADYTAAGMAPTFQVDPFWPKPLPNHWILGATIGVDVDSRDHVWIVHRSTPDQFMAAQEIGAAQDPPLSECCVPAPPVLEFDPDGDLVSAWGGESTDEYTWPTSNHGITVDHMDNVWIGGNGRTEEGIFDRHVVKFSRDGEFLAQYGTPGAETNSTSMENFGRVAKIFVDPTENEAYFADGYSNRRVAVLDASTGEVQRIWGAYGNEPDDSAAPERYEPGETPPQQFRTPVHCAEMSVDRLVYVCDRPSNRISIFQPDGTFVSEHIVAPATRAQGSTWDIDFSPDPDQTWLYLADGQNMKVYVIRRADMEVVYSFGDGGRQPGLFFAVHSIAVDSDGNIYTTETYEGTRVQKFRFMGMEPAPEGDTGPAWPEDRRRADG